MFVLKNVQKVHTPLLLCLALLMLLGSRPVVAQTCSHDGDVNQDGKLTPADALMTFQQFLGIANPSLDACRQDRANVNRDGTITPADALCIFQAFLGIESCLSNHPPQVVNPPEPVTVKEDGEAVVIDLTDTFEDPDGDPLTLSVTVNTHPDRVPTAMADKTLTLAFLPDQHDDATLTIRASDGRGGQVETTLEIKVHSVNDPPGFTKGEDQVVPSGSGPQTVANWATDIGPGAANEADQTVAFHVTTDNEALFVDLPVLTPDGTLTYTPGATPGIATVTVSLQDDGGTTDGGMDTSNAQRFKIRIVDESVRLVVVSGNKQVVAPGQELQEPLVVRLESLFGTPIVGEAVTAEVVQGEAEIIIAEASPGGATLTASQAAVSAAGLTVITDTQGEARFTLRAGDSSQDIVVAVSARGHVVNFLTVVLADFPSGLAVEADHRLVMVDAALARVERIDSESGARTVVSGCLTESCEAVQGDGPAFVLPAAITPLPGSKTTTEQLIVTDVGLAAIVQVDSTSGRRTVISGCLSPACQDMRGDGPVFVSPIAIAVLPDSASGTAQLVVADMGLSAVLRVEPISGDRSVVSGCLSPVCQDVKGSGPLIAPVAVAVEAGEQESEHHLVMLGADPPAVLRVDPHSGDRAIVSDDEHGGGPSLASPRDIAVKPNGQLVVADDCLSSNLAVLNIDPISGNRSILADGFGVPLVPVAVAVENSGNLVVVDMDLSSVGRVDAINGNTAIVSDRPRGSGPSFEFPTDIAVEANGALVVADPQFAAIIRVDPGSGDRTVVSGCLTPTCMDLVGDGLNDFRPYQLAVEHEGQLVIADNERPAIIRVDPISGNRTLVSGCRQPSCTDTTAIRGDGPLFVNPSGIAVAADGQIIISDNDGPLLRVNPVDGNRTVVSGRSALDVAVEANGQLITVGVGSLSRIDPDTRILSPLSDEILGNGPPFFSTLAVAIENSGSILVINATAEEFSSVMRVDPADGNRAFVTGGFPNVVGRGPFLLYSRAVAVERDGNLVVLEGLYGNRGVVRVNPTTGNRTIVSRSSIGQLVREKQKCQLMNSD